ncbi:MAG: NAD(P)H-hydrate epimerase [Anaerolineales bacterium]|nr:NAD(P)H-hydrate epimerase [Anaerolineales bacterium]
MTRKSFRTEHGLLVPAVTEDEMRMVDHITVEDFNLSILQMMENAGRNLAQCTLAMLDESEGPVTVLAGSGGNGGGGICCARHLHNRGISVNLVLSRDPDALEGAARAQLEVLLKTELLPIAPARAPEAIGDAAIVVDALLGYSLQGAPRGRTKELIEFCNRDASHVLSLDLPSGMDATSGETPGVVVHAARTLTLALPKSGLTRYEGDLYLADIGIPPEVYRPLGIEFEPFFGDRYWLKLLY